MKNPLKEGDVGSLHGHMCDMVRNPFQNPEMRKGYDRAILCYDEKKESLITKEGRRCIGNSWATRFWQGFDGQLEGKWTASDKKTSGYVFWRAGYDVRHALLKNK